jgi:hypothetical protein
MRKSPRGLIALAATVAALVGGQAAIASAQASTTVSVTPALRTGSANFPFGRANLWPKMGFVYKNIPAFDLKAGDTIAFDLGAPNDVDIQLQIEMAATTVNGGEIPGTFTTVVPNTQVPANPLGNSTVGDYELQFTAQAPFHFTGGGLIIRFSNPGGLYAGDTTNPVDNMLDVTTSGDSSGFFVKRFWGDADGLPPYDNADSMAISGFRLTLLDLPPATSPPPATPGTPPVAKKKCKKKHKRAASAKKKKCKRKRR